MVKAVKGLPAGWGVCFRTVLLDNIPLALSYWKNTIAVGSRHKDIIFFNAITGSQAAVFSGHTDRVTSLVFSPNGASLISGSNDMTVKLWDIQTGGVVKTFSGHTDWVWSVSISADCTKIASGSEDKTMRLWDIQSGECHGVIKQWDIVYHVSFSPTNPQYLLSKSNYKIWQWDIDGHQIPPTYNGFCFAFSPNGTQLVLCTGRFITIQDSGSRAIVAGFHVPDSNTRRCCFSPDGRLVAVAAGHTTYIWDITGLDPHLIETFIGHTSFITSLVFSSPTSLISASEDQSIKFWQIGAPSTDSVVTNPNSASLTLSPIKTITLQAKDGIAITSDLDGVVKTWDISTGFCKASFQTPAEAFREEDVKLIDGRLILTWHAKKKIHTWDLKKEELLWEVDGSGYTFQDLKISGDGLKVFCLDSLFLHAWSLQTGEVVGKVDFGDFKYSGSLTVDGSRVWIHYSQSEYQGWDFQTPGPSPIQLPPGVFTDRLHLTDTMLWDASLSRIKDVDTGKVVFQLSGRFANPSVVQHDGQYLAAGYASGELLILEFNYMSPQ